MSILNIPTWVLIFLIILGLAVVYAWVYSYKGKIFAPIAEEKDKKEGE